MRGSHSCVVLWEFPFSRSFLKSIHEHRSKSCAFVGSDGSSGICMSGVHTFSFFLEAVVPCRVESK